MNKPKPVKRPYKVAPTEDDWNPAVYVVWQHMPSGRKHRVGGAHTLAEAEAMIIDGDKSLRNTFGGLIAPSEGGVYSIWKAVNWERVA